MISCDVVIIGAGPSGSSAAAVLAEKGHKVILIERSRFPVITLASRYFHLTAKS